MEKKEKEKFRYPVFSARIDQETLDWLKIEARGYDSWNKFFKELKKRYEKNN
jgi:hypothetical protein